MPRPRGMVVFDSALSVLPLLSDEDAGRAFKAAARYFSDGTEPGALSDKELILFTLMRKDIDQGQAKYEATCERNRRNGSKRSHSEPLGSTGFQSQPMKSNGNELKETESILAGFKCEICGRNISDGVKQFSQAKYNRSLCQTCQSKVAPANRLLALYGGSPDPEVVRKSFAALEKEFGASEPE